MSTLTSANSAFALAIVGLFNTPQLLQGYATDDSFAANDVTTVEVAMGVDGFMSGGFTPVPVVIDVNLQADSLSMFIFDEWINAQLAAREVYIANGSISLPATGQKYALTRGMLTSYTPMPGGKKILQPRKFSITFQSVIAANA